MVGDEHGTGVVGQVDIADRGGRGGPPDQHRGDPRVAQLPGQRVVRVQRQHDRAVGLALAEVTDQPGAGLGGADDLQPELDPGGPQDAHDAADHASEVRVGEEPAHERVVVVALRVGDHEGDGAAAPGHERAGGPVRDVADLGDGLPHDLVEPGVDIADPVHHAGDGGAGDSRLPRHVLKGRLAHDRRGYP
jgi:hypothetical protein